MIALKGTGGPGRQENSKVSFQVVDGSGSPVTGVPVHFALSTNVGGISLSSRTVSTNPDGTASTTVRAGNVATSVRVTATIDAEDENGNFIELTTVSDELVISTGLPDQNSISLSVSSLSAGGGMDRDGITVDVTVRMADKFNNPRPRWYCGNLYHRVRCNSALVHNRQRILHGNLEQPEPPASRVLVTARRRLP